MPHPASRLSLFKTTLSPAEIHRKFFSDKPSVLLESARLNPKTGRYSIVAGDPFLLFSAKKDSVALTDFRGTRRLRENPFNVLKKLLNTYGGNRARHNLPFEGGALGFVSYEAKNILEPNSFLDPAHDDLGVPDLFFIFTETGFLWDHQEEKVWKLGPGKHRPIRIQSRPVLPFRQKEFYFKASVTRKDFLQRVLRAKEYIRRGDIFQANLSQRFSFAAPADAHTLYAKLKKINPSSFFGLLDAGDFQIISGSPERLVELKGGILSTRPIAGTRSRATSAKEDRLNTLDLLLSAKERSEHIMLVDLERNDLGRVAEIGSVSVDELMVIEDYSHVKHIVSNICARLGSGFTAVDALAAMFPGGTITGAPKIRSAQIIDELEGEARGSYTGSLGYFSFTGDMDFNIIIRSLLLKNGTAHVSAGAGIVADSDPSKEYDETLYKAEAVLTALFGRARTGQIKSRLLAGKSLS